MIKAYHPIAARFDNHYKVLVYARAVMPSPILRAVSTLYKTGRMGGGHSSKESSRFQSMSRVLAWCARPKQRRRRYGRRLQHA